MLMQILTVAAAVAYVEKIEAEWYGAAKLIRYAAHELVNGWEDCLGVAVHTSENTWSVWMERDGSLYGEC